MYVCVCVCVYVYILRRIYAVLSAVNLNEIAFIILSLFWYTLLPDNGLFQLKRSVNKFLRSIIIDTEYFLICNSHHAFSNHSTQHWKLL